MKKNIPFFNYKEIFANNENEFVQVYKDVCSRGAFILQSDLEEFEKNAAKYLKVKHFIGVANGTDAIWLGLKALDIGHKDEIIMPSHTYIASAAAAHFVGAIPILAECGSDHMLDPLDIEKRITSKTKAIMAVQINGRCCDMDRIIEISNKHNLFLIEDAAQAFGAKYNNQNAGSFGEFGTFSFYPAKLLGCFGDGGGIVTSSDKLAEKLRLLRDHGRNNEGEVVEWGFNSRLDNLQAALLNKKLEHFNKDISRRREIALRYNDQLRAIENIKLPPSPKENNKYFDVYQNYEIVADHRDRLKIFLDEEGIKTIIQWAGKPVHGFKNLGFQDVNLPRTDLFFQKCLMLPMNVTITNDDVDYITSKIKHFYQNA